MEREIKFRGLTESGEWVYGDLLRYESGEAAILGRPFSAYGHEATEICRRTSVRMETVGQFTGLKDKHETEIYEGDVVKWSVNDIKVTAPIFYDERQASFWMGKDVKGKMGLVLNDWMRGEYEVIGNVFEDGHLLENE